MKIRCIKTYPDKNDLLMLGQGFEQHQDFQMEIGQEFLVLGIVYGNKDYLGNGIFVEHAFRKNRIGLTPLCMFEIIDNRISKYWKLQPIEKKQAWCLSVADFDAPNFYEDLSEDEPWAVEIFNRVYKQLEEEHATPIAETSPQTEQVELEYA